MKIFALSDIHVDYETNSRWISNLSRFEYQDDVLILAGDVSDVPSILEDTFRRLSERFKKVAFVPGNHDLWVRRDHHKNSLDKERWVNELARGYDLAVEPFHIGSLSIVPLLGWYDYSFGQPSDHLYEVWNDYRACIWPDDMHVEDVTRYFVNKNKAFLQVDNKKIISFSHFLPRIDVMPSFITKPNRMLYPILGSEQIEQQIRQLKPDIHVYGHSHVNRRVTIDGILYLNNAFGYPSETRITTKELLCIYEH